VIADHTAYDVRYSYRLLAGITVIPAFSFKLKLSCYWCLSAYSCSLFCG